MKNVVIKDNRGEIVNNIFEIFKDLGNAGFSLKVSEKNPILKKLGFFTKAELHAAENMKQ